jgi:hypothetical protein
MSSVATRPAFASASRRQAALQSKSPDTRLKSAELQKILSRKIVTTSQARDQTTAYDFVVFATSLSAVPTAFTRARTPRNRTHSELRPLRQLPRPSLSERSKTTSRAKPCNRRPSTQRIAHLPKSRPRKSHHALRLAIKTTADDFVVFATSFSAVPTAFTRARTPRNRTHRERRPLRQLPKPSLSERSKTTRRAARAIAAPNAHRILLLLSPPRSRHRVWSHAPRRPALPSKQRPSRWALAAAKPTLEGPGALRAPVVPRRSRREHPETRARSRLRES